MVSFNLHHSAWLHLFTSFHWLLFYFCQLSKINIFASYYYSIIVDFDDFTCCMTADHNLWFLHIYFSSALLLSLFSSLNLCSSSRASFQKTMSSVKRKWLKNSPITFIPFSIQLSFIKMPSSAALKSLGDTISHFLSFLSILMSFLTFSLSVWSLIDDVLWL